jgi:hypothetical protein
MFQTIKIDQVLRNHPDYLSAKESLYMILLILKMRKVILWKELQVLGAIDR